MRVTATIVKKSNCRPEDACIKCGFYGAFKLLDVRYCSQHLKEELSKKLNQFRFNMVFICPYGCVDRKNKPLRIVTCFWSRNGSKKVSYCPRCGKEVIR